MSDPLLIAGREFQSRLVVGTGKYPSHAVMQAAHEASGTEMVTVAVRRVDLKATGAASLLSWIDTTRIFSCRTPPAATPPTRPCGRRGWRGRPGFSNWIKLEVIGDERTLFPDNEGLLEATRTLVKEGFVVLPYTNDDPIACRKLEDAGAAAVMPLGAPIGSGWASRTRATSRSSRSRPTFRSSSTPVWARRPTPPLPWSSAPTACS